MLRATVRLGLIAATLAAAGCGDNVNTPAPDASSPDYAKKSSDKMKDMYGAPKPERPK